MFGPFEWSWWASMSAQSSEKISGALPESAAAGRWQSASPCRECPRIPAMPPGGIDGVDPKVTFATGEVGEETEVSADQTVVVEETWTGRARMATSVGLPPEE